MIGRALGHYEVVELLGSGGMGEVYRAHDPRLKRDVAIKVLAEAFATDPERLARLEREAHLLAALNHPNVATIHGLEEDRSEVEDGVSGAPAPVRFLVLELVEGETLADRLRSGPLELEAALEIARQIAEGLAAAHAKGILHRDLKPANVAVTTEGRVKLLDFGLAKSYGPVEREKGAGAAAGTGTEAGAAAAAAAAALTHSPTVTVARSEAGVLWGTAPYMSPEQVRGQALDERTDIWSFGCVLYELLTGKRAFAGETVSDTLAAILKEEPDWRAVPASTPGSVRRLLGRCLAKQPRQRLQHIGDARIEIEETFHESVAAAQAPDELAPVVPESMAARDGRGYRKMALAGGLVAAAALFVVFLAPPAPPRIPESGYTRLTASPFMSIPPAASPYPLVTDGSRIYFDEFINGQLFHRQVSIGGGEPVTIPSPFPTSWWPQILNITPDGRDLLVGASEAESRFWLVPLVGGSPRRLGEVVGQASTWSPDGNHVLYANGSVLYLARSDGTEPRKLLDAPGRAYWPRYSPDGSRIRFSFFDPKQSGRMEIWEAAADGSGLHPLLPGWSDPPNLCCGSWTPDGEHYVFQATRDGRTDIWAIRERTGPFRSGPSDPVQLTSGAAEFIRPTIAPDGETIFAISWQLRGELQRYDTRSGQFAPYLSPLSAEQLDFSRDGEWITYVTYPEADLWRSRADGSERLQLTFPPLRVRAPAWSPDGETIAFEGQLPHQHWSTYLVRSNGGVSEPLTPEDRHEASPTWSADGGSLAVFRGSATTEADAGLSAEHMGPGIYILDLASGSSSKLPESEGLRAPAWSPDGRYLAAQSAGRRRLVLFDFATRRWDELADIIVGPSLSWSQDGEYLYVWNPSRPLGPARAVHRVRVRDRSHEEVVRLGNVRQTWGVGGPWGGTAPDGSPLLLQDQSIHHLYALDWER